MQKSDFVLFSFLSSLLFAGCGPTESNPEGSVVNGDKIEEQRIRSPDGKVDAILERTPTDPLSSDVLSVRLAPVGAKLEWEGVILYATHTDSTFKMRWLADRLLEISYGTGHMSGFDNEWWTYRLDPKGENAYFVEIRLIKTIPELH